LRLPEDDADASKHVAVLTVYKILLMYMCCAFVGLYNKQFIVFYITLCIILDFQE